MRGRVSVQTFANVEVMSGRVGSQSTVKDRAPFRGLGRKVFFPLPWVDDTLNDTVRARYWWGRGHRGTIVNYGTVLIKKK